MIQYFKDVLQKSWVVKGFLALLTLSFGIWGVGDFLRPGMDPKIAVTIGKTDVGLQEVSDRFSRALDQMKQKLGPIDSEDMKRSILNTTVRDVTRETTIDEAARNMGLIMTDAHLREAIRNDPTFKDETGAFSQILYSRILYDNHLTERGFLRLYSADLRQRAMLQPVAMNSVAPQSLVATLATYRAERRTADAMLIATASLPAPPAPTEDELKKAYEQNIATFTSPEYRKVQAVVIRSDEMVSPDSLTDDQLKAFYDENMDRYRTHETRHVEQIVFDTKDQAEAARAQAAAGDHLEEVAKKAKTSVVDLGDIPKTSPLVKTMGAAYDMPVGEISQPIQSDLGWHLFEVKEIKPEVVRDFAAVKDEIRKTMAADKGTDALYDASQTLEDTVTGGASMEDAANKVGGKVITIDAMDRDGKDPTGNEVKGLIDNDKFIKAAFALQTGSESKLMEIPKGYYILRVEGITPPKAKPLDEVRKQVTEIAINQKRSTAARELADKIVAEIKPDTALQPIAAKNNATFAELGPVDRFGQSPTKGAVDSKTVSPELLEKIFAAKPGEVVTAPVLQGVVVARLRDVIPPATSELTGGEAQMAASVRQDIANDLVMAMSEAFAQRYPAKVNNAALDPLVTSNR